MRITVQFAAQIRQAAGTGSTIVETADGLNVNQLVCQIADGSNDTLKNLLHSSDNLLQPALLVFVNDKLIQRSRKPAPCSVILSDGDVVTLMSPMSGG